MNMCFIIGKIVSKIEFNFILNSNNISIVKFKIELKNKSIIDVKGYDEIADWCYQNLEETDEVEIYGEINSKMEIIILDIEK